MSATFPLGVWDGTSRVRPDDSVTREPAGYDYDRISEEVRAIQRHLLGGPSIKNARTITSNDEVVFDDYAIYGDATLGEIRLTLGNASDFDLHVITVKKMDASANKVILVGTVDGVIDSDLDTQYDSLTIQAFEGTWRVV